MGERDTVVRIGIAPARRIVEGLERLRVAMNEDCLQDCSCGWNTARFDPSKLLSAVRHVRLKPGIKLAAYQYHDGGGNGNGYVIAIPAGRRVPSHARFGYELHGICGKLPKWADGCVERHLEGDGTPESYFEASMLSREFGELGAIWHGGAWANHKVLFSAKGVPSNDLTWTESRPDDWRPVFRRDGAATTITFWTFTGLVYEGVIRFEDRYTRAYTFGVESTRLATGRGGYVP